MASIVVSILALAGVCGTASGNAFLRGQSADAQTVSVQAVEQTLLAELALVGRDEHLLQLQEQLRPTFAALPKNSLGRLDAPVVRYALHRFFVQTRGWFVQGLQPDGEARDSAASVKIMKDRVPGFIQELLERRVAGRGLELSELAAFAATIQDLVHAEGMQNLLDVFMALDLPTGESISPAQLQTAMETYMMSYILGSNLSDAGAGKVAELRRGIEEVYPAWPDVQLWAQDVRQTVLLDRTRAGPFQLSRTGLEEAAELMQEMGHQFGSFQDQECRAMKDSLVELEYRGTGRVRLSEFYKGSLAGNWQFAESVEYLRAIGALDESNPKSPAVLIANYVGSQSNCLASSSFYSVCCLDECEGLMGQLEVAIGAPMAEPIQIAHLVAGMSSDTVDAPRNLTAPLLLRLDDIASHHGGLVPLHGRLFAQWMHHAYPRECPYPHLAGTTNPMTPDEWMASSGSVVASEADMRRHVAAGNGTVSLEEDIDPLPWAQVEELVAAHEPSRGAGALRAAGGLLAKALLLTTAAALLVPSVSGSCGKLRDAFQQDSKLPRYVV